MRPVRLVAEGFTAFRDLIDVDFEAADFFALVGPTGSGKSSILDAICFALYGSVPRYADDRVVAPAITQGANEARVSLTFELAGEQYVATRIVRRTKTGASTKEARLEHGNEILAGDAREMNAAVVDLIGLPFHHFTRCVVLPQGDFAEFLHDKPADRQDLIVKLLDLSVYERMRQRAGARATEGENAIQVDELRITALAECTPEAEADARARVGEVKKLRARLQAAAETIRQLEDDATAAVRTAENAGRVVTMLESVKVPKPVMTLNEQRRDARVAHDAARLAREEAESAFGEQAALVSQLADPIALQQLLDAHEQLEGIRLQVGALDVARAEAAPRFEAARAAHEKAVHDTGHADAEFEAALEDTVATDLAAALVVGEACPVCQQIVERKPKVRPGAKDKARKTRDATRRAEAKARDAMDKLAKQNERVETERQTLATQASGLERKVAAAPDAAIVSEQLDAVQAAHREHADRQTAVRNAVSNERAAASAAGALDDELAKARRACEAQRDPLVGAGLDAPGIGTDFVADWEALAVWASGEIPAHAALRKEQTQRARELAEAAQRAVQELVETSAACGVRLPGRTEPTVSALREQAAAAERDASAEAKRIAVGIKESAGIATRIAVARETVTVARELARLLRSDRFEQWVVNEALESLVGGASLTLEQLSGNQYALAVDAHNEFEVVDHRNADERRSAKTLSGGETFQAALALSLALADQVGALANGGAAKLDAIFLDEGFGTLDPDCLDTVAATLETLGGDARMVGIVTHVRDLADRVPVRFEVTKGPSTSSVVRVDT